MYSEIEEIHGNRLGGPFWEGQNNSTGRVQIFLATVRGVARFFQQCQICQLSEGTAQNIDLYSPLPLAEAPWVDKLWTSLSLCTQNNHDSIFVVVDRFSKMAYFIPYRKINDATQITTVF